jgi:hypothetical protein
VPTPRQTGGRFDPNVVDVFLDLGIDSVRHAASAVDGQLYFLNTLFARARSRMRSRIWGPARRASALDPD